MDKMRDNARKRVIEMFTFDVFANQLDDILKSM